MEKYRSGHNGLDSKSSKPLTGSEGSNPSFSANEESIPFGVLFSCRSGLSGTFALLPVHSANAKIVRFSVPESLYLCTIAPESKRFQEIFYTLIPTSPPHFPLLFPVTADQRYTRPIHQVRENSDVHKCRRSLKKLNDRATTVFASC